MRLSNRIESLPPYLFAQISKIIAKKKEEGVDVISLGIGDPDLPTPQRIINKLVDAANIPANHRYPESEGLPEFRQAVASYYKDRHNVELNFEDEVTSLIGSKEAIINFSLCVINPGDYALVTDPGYPVYEIGTMLAGGESYKLPLTAEQDWLPDLDCIPDDILAKSKILWVNYPNNPTGAIANDDFYEKVIAWGIKHDIIIAHDLAYSEVTFDGYTAPSILEYSNAKDICIELNSLSKSYNMTGWRIAMAVGNKDLVHALRTIKSNIDSGAPQAIQEMAIEALTGPRDDIVEHNKIYQLRRDKVVASLEQLGLTVNNPKASLYVWAKIPSNEESSATFVSKIIDETGVVLTPGNGYGEYGEGYIRVSLTTPDDQLDEALQRLNDYIK
ncbi:MAG: LL-diaminopimelate aminotransferase [Chloroflexi bacterium]|nr:LL-diaminopimelate aminotransferase [Chloroflexota bacterium]|tara:strand:+ start:7550 stop:8713 length:1164 start_codon:yes stop_codon:yes gene_type:complete